MSKIITIIFALSFSIINANASVEVAKKIFPSTVLIVMEDNQGIILGYGSGFLVKENIVVTNHHVINGAKSGYVKFINEDEIYEIEGVLAHNENRDLAVLQISFSGKSNYITYATSPPEIGEEIFALGNPMGLEGTFSDGIVSGIRNYEDATLFQITAPISPGNSGGPVVNSNSQLIGVATSYLTGGQNLNFAVPYSYVKEIINISKINNFVDFPNVDYQNFANKDSSSTNSLKAMHIGKIACIYVSSCSVGFSINNTTRNVIDSVTFKLLIEAENSPVDYKVVTRDIVIEAKLSKRIETRVSSDAIEYACSSNYQGLNRYKSDGCLKVEIIDFSFKN
tara:strand:+ start:1985 stop:2998 length:1014 start_codon:yes stop_codon:yes gene_type:complete